MREPAAPAATSSATAAAIANAPAPQPSPPPVAGGEEARPAAPPPAPSPSSSPSPLPLSAPPSTVAALRSRLEAVEQRVETELGRAAQAATSAAARLGDLARAEAAGEHARDAVQTVAALWPGLRERLSSLASLRRLVSPGELDAYGMDRELAARAAPLLEFLYDSWWRVVPRHIEKVPAAGPVVVVANHGGALPWDALVLRVALRRDHPARRDLRPLLDADALQMPVAGGLARRLGAVAATPDHALRLLGEGGVVAVFPEGSRNGLRAWPQRYRIHRFGRGGFVKLALRTGAAIVPCAVVGSEETSAPFARDGWLADRLGLPALAAPALPLAPLAFLPLPSRWSLRFGDPIDTRAMGPDAASSPERVLDLTEHVRATLQDMLDEEVAARRTVYL